MFTNFDLGVTGLKIMGYLWDVDDPCAVMCVIHGLATHAGRYDRMAGFLNKAGIAVMGLDLPGHGRSGGKKGDCAPRSKVFDCVSKLLLTASFRYPGVPVILYGHSMGGGICLDYRDRGDLNDLPAKYIVSAPWLKLASDVPKPVPVTVKAASRVLPKLVLSSKFDPSILGNPAIVSQYANDPLVHPCMSLRTAVDGYYTGLEICEGRHESNHRADGKPLLLMHGTDDMLCSIDGSRMFAKLHAGEPGFTYIEWPGYYHEIHNGGPEATGEKVIETIIDFIKGAAVNG
ncbi:MAG: lysophospholipase [Firmicutes bacterium]|nr:lysophospholipase [Bacillota bacterium]